MSPRKKKDSDDGDVKELTENQKLRISTATPMVSDRDFFKINLDNMFMAWHDAKGYRKNIHASDILRSDEIEYGKDQRFCLRECVLLNFYEQELKPHDIWTVRRFLNGWMLHEKWQELMEAHGKVVAVEQEVENTDYGFKIVFTPDAIVEFFKKQWIVEIKGYKSDSYNKLDENGVPPESAHDQCNLYMHLTGIHQGFIIVENKDNSAFKVWAIKYNEEIVKPYLDRLSKLQKLVEEHKINSSLPERLCETYGCERAERCNVRDACFYEAVRKKHKLPAEEWTL